MDMTNIFIQMAILFIIMVAGFMSVKLKAFDETIIKSLSIFFSSFIFPALVINSILNSSAELTGSEAVTFLLLSLLTLSLAVPVAILVPVILRVQPDKASVYRFMMICVNVGFVGYPVAQAAYGEAAAFYLGLFIVMGNFFTFSVGILLLTGQRGEISFKKILTQSPIMIVTVICFVLFIFGFKLPGPIHDTVEALSNVAVPLGMIIVGATLGTIPFKSVVTDWRLYIFAFVKLIVLPVITFLILRNLIPEKVPLGCLVIAAGLPVAAICSVISAQYKKDSALASKSILITTLFSMVTLPAILYFFKLL